MSVIYGQIQSTSISLRSKELAGQLTLKEICRLVGNQVTSKVLRGVDQASDDGSPQIGALEKIEQGRLAEAALNLYGPLDHGELLSSVVLGLVTKAFDRSEGFLLASFADEPPWRFGSEKGEDQKRSLRWVVSLSTYTYV